jgi:FAD/FMN-containing dehydrogenase
MILNRRRFVHSLAAAAAAIPATRLWADAASATPAVTVGGKQITLSASDLKDLRGGLHGKLLLAQDEGYETARKLWNPMFDRHPALIAQCAGPEDVARAVTFARAHDLLTAVRGGGHSLSGQSACDHGLMIDLSPMKDIRLDTQRSLGRAQGGVLLGELDRKTQDVGLVTTLGTATDTGIAGLTLGGGMGRMMRRHGLSCDNLQSVEVVTADGKILHVSDSENADLFWAIRGGGGNFGVVTAFEYRLHPLKENILDGDRVYPFSKARELLDLMAEVGERAPDDLTLGVELVNLTSAESPHPGRAALLEVTYLGKPSDGERLLEPFKKLGMPIADRLTSKTYLEAQGAAGTAPIAVPGGGGGTPEYIKTGFLNNTPTAFLDELVRGVKETPDSQMLAVECGQMGGAVSRVSPEATAYWGRKATHNLLVITEWKDRGEDQPHIKAARQVWATVEKFTEGFYVNTEPGADDKRVRGSYGGNYARLQQLKTKYDPTNLFRLNANIKPGTSA